MLMPAGWQEQTASASESVPRRAAFAEAAFAVDHSVGPVGVRAGEGVELEARLSSEGWKIAIAAVVVAVAVAVAPWPG